VVIADSGARGQGPHDFRTPTGPWPREAPQGSTVCSARVEACAADERYMDRTLLDRLARRNLLEAIQAHRHVASARGVEIALTGLAHPNPAEVDFARAAQLAAGVEADARAECIVNVYADKCRGREVNEEGRAALSAGEIDRAMRVSRGLSIRDALELARTP
jgi:hypothetical protein